MVFGTPEFMSPEQAQGKSLTPASDVYSLAVILYEVLTGKLPFDAKSAMDYIQLHVTGKPIPLSQRVPGKTFPPLLDQIMERALAKRSEERYPSAAEFGAALRSRHPFVACLSQPGLQHGQQFAHRRSRKHRQPRAHTHVDRDERELLETNDCVNATVAAGASCAIQVTFTPQATGR